jgi:hypothetical protein
MELYDLLTSETLMALAQDMNRGETFTARRLLEAGVGEADQAAFRRYAASLRVAADQASPCDRPCLDDNLLAEYVDGVLGRADRGEVERHLAACPTCLDEAVSLASLVHEVVPAPPLTEVALHLVGRGLHWLSRPAEGFSEEALSPVPVLSAATTEAPARRWTQTVGDTTLRFTASMPEHELLTLVVETVEAPSGARLALWLDGSMVESRPVGGDGCCTLRHLTPGNYTVELGYRSAPATKFPLKLVLNEE